jgi:NitT/TauT family transport system substrate-binding protein
LPPVGKNLFWYRHEAARTVRSMLGGIGGRLRTAAVALIVMAAAAGCGLLGGSDTAPAADGAPPTLRVSIMPTTDLAPFHLAMQNGYFQAEGVQVEAVTSSSGQASLAKLIGGELEIAYASYTPFFVAQGQGAADLRFVADASSAAPGTVMIVAMPRSGVATVADLAGKRIAITATNTISDTLVKSAMRQAGVDFSGVQWISIPFAETAPALARGDVDAAFLTEPFITIAERSVGAVPIVDTATGPAANLPTAGYATLASFADENRDAIAAFQRALAKATDEAADRGKVEPLLVEHTGIDRETASATALLTFRSALDARELQRVPDLLLEFGVLRERVDASAMIGPAP